MSTAGDGPRRRASGAGSGWLAGTAIAAFLALGVWLFGGSIAYSESGAPTPGDPTADGATQDLIAPPGTDQVDQPHAHAAAVSAGAPRLIGNAGLVDSAWATEVASRTGIPLRAILGYAGAELAMRSEAPACHLGWNTLAALGHIESGHGTHDGSSLDDRGIARPPILGPDLDGAAYDRIDDTDGGVIDGSATTDRAAGPLQFIPSTWQRWGADGDADGVADPQQIDDASLAAARYLCSYGDLSDDAAWRRAIFAYNHVESYVDAVAAAASAYAEHARG